MSTALSFATSDFSSKTPAVSDLFEAGNYAQVAMYGGSDDWQTYAAFGLIGKTQIALEGLSQFDHDMARFYTAVAHWIGGDDAAALPILETLTMPQAHNLLALIQKPQIQVLAQLPWNRAGSWDLLTASANDPKFQVSNISFHPDDYRNEPYADIHQFYDPNHPPDFYICQMVEWHLIPPNLQELECPLFGQTGDYDLHIQAVYPWLNLFDHLLVTDQTEWQDVHKLVSVPVSTFPKSFGVPDQLPDLSDTPRMTDLFLSGTVTHPYHPDKAQLLHQLLAISGLKTKIVNGFDAQDNYLRNLNDTKVCFTYVRHPSALPTRGLEALGMGCGLVVQQDSVLTLFVGQEEGVLTYELEANNLATGIHHILENWDDFEQRARRGADIIRAEFSASRVASQYLRFLTVLAAQPKQTRSPQARESLVQKRMILQKGWLPSYDFNHDPILHQIGVCNQARLQTRIKAEQPSSHGVIDLARELVLYNYHMALQQVIPMVDWLEQLTDLYRAGVSQFPKSLVLRFNFIRVALHFGDPTLVSYALNLLDETLSQPLSHWRIDGFEDVFPWDFCGNYFNYRQYFDQVTAHLTQGVAVEDELIRLIVASLHYYRGFYRPYQGFYIENQDDFGKAIALDPHFPYYKFRYAQALINRGLPADYEEAGKHLIELGNQSILFQEAFALLQKLEKRRLFRCPEFEELMRKVRRGREVHYSENIPEAPLRPALHQSQPPLDRFRFELPEFPPEVVEVVEVVEPPEPVPVVPPPPSPIKLLRAELRKTQEELAHTQGILDCYRARVQAMESSKFWQIRQAWIRLKRGVRLTSEEEWREEFSDKPLE